MTTTLPIFDMQGMSQTERAVRPQLKPTTCAVQPGGGRKEEAEEAADLAAAPAEHHTQGHSWVELL